jgi:uncharacterized protein YkwD
LGGRLIAWTVLFTATLAVASAGSAPGETVATQTDWSSAETQLRTSLLTGLNQVRARYGLGGLEIEHGLDEAAIAHSDEMLVDGYFGHLSSDGAPFWERIERFYPPPRIGSWRVGENLLWIPGPISAGRIISLWMASRGHRANILSPAWRQIGIGVGAEGDAPGVFGGRTVTVVTVDFGVRT